MSDHVFIIAEGGVNHDGSLASAIGMVQAAARAGADAIKFQTFRAEKLVTPSASKADYQKRTVGGDDSQYGMLKALELDAAAHHALAAACSDAGIEFMSTAFDVESLSFLVEEIGIRRVKIPSGEITNPQMLLAAGRSGRPVLLSTGMATLIEIEAALGVLAFAMARDGGAPNMAAFGSAWKDRRSLLTERVTVLQCTTAYPAPAEDINLRAMDTFAATFGLPIGFSDHSLGTALAIAAAGRGATVIEKHFTLDRTLPGPDHAASLGVHELTRMIADIRMVEKALGTGEKVCSPSEVANVALARRGVYAARDIAADEMLSEADAVLLRPESGVSPMALWDVVGKPASRAYHKLNPFDR